jgi:hypothetical protein
MGAHPDRDLESGDAVVKGTYTLELWGNAGLVTMSELPPEMSHSLQFPMPALVTRVTLTWKPDEDEPVDAEYPWVGKDKP